ncbi:hypothetical protein HAX54_043777 [Datura stramonium]|uniref:Uncharacterized protein n=1 Tax=Datura stramonium TaxID=4076 RepID=A0ABS8W611_DATST|nr:hypothetical protein [Datura stramonium]
MKIFYFFIIFPILNNISCQLLPPLPALNLTFLDQNLALIFPIIQNFKKTITLDPFGVTQTWTGPDICNYKGFYCDNPPYNSSAISLSSIDFNGFQLSAPTLDGFIDQLPDLAIFHANSNNFSGIISSKISNLPYLYELDLSNNKFMGTFPISILNIKTLTFLDIRYNLFTGTIPPQIFIQNLDAFFLNNNNFIQNLPDNLGSTSAFYLTLANNKFVGPIPRSIGQAPNLLEILLLNNLLNGCIPYQLGLLKKATVIDVGFNMLTGPLPCSLGCLESVEQLNFAGNLLYGQTAEADDVEGDEEGSKTEQNSNLLASIFSTTKCPNNSFISTDSHCIRTLPTNFSTSLSISCTNTWVLLGYLSCSSKNAGGVYRYHPSWAAEENPRGPSIKMTRPRRPNKHFRQQNCAAVVVERMPEKGFVSKQKQEITRRNCNGGQWRSCSAPPTCGKSSRRVQSSIVKKRIEYSRRQRRVTSGGIRTGFCNGGVLHP